MAEEIQLDKRIKKVGIAAKEAFADLRKIQYGEKRLLRTGEEMIDCHIGSLLEGDVVLISAPPGAGKSETLYRMIEKIMSKDVNPTADNFCSLEFNLEMKMLNRLLRSTHNLLNKKKSEILFNKFNEEEALKVKEYYENLQDDRRFVVQEPVSADEFYNMVETFATLHKDRDAILISIDHLLLLTGTDKQAVLEKVSEYINLLKLKFNNLYFILLSQTNRMVHTTVKERSNDMRPNNSWIFGSSFMEQLASYIIIQTNPFKQGVSEYLSVYPERYEYLEKYFTEPNSKGKVSFNTLGNLFYVVTKTRESDDFTRDLFIKEMDLSKEQLEKMKSEVKEEDFVSNLKAPVFTQPDPMPIFDSAKFNTSPKDAFGDDEEEEKDNTPF
jgi:KaiC/GvpD/RAD55 family RecA-like ATPase